MLDVLWGELGTLEGNGSRLSRGLDLGEARACWAEDQYDYRSVETSGGYYLGNPKLTASKDTMRSGVS
jgi:hypothetical protein